MKPDMNLDQRADFYFDNVMKCDDETKRGFYKLAFGDGWRAGYGIKNLEKSTIKLPEKIVYTEESYNEYRKFLDNNDMKEVCFSFASRYNDGYNACIKDFKKLNDMKNDV